MTVNQTVQSERAPSGARVGATTRSLLGQFARQFADLAVSFDVTLPDGSVQHFGPAASRFTITLKNSRALRAIASLDEGRFGDAYLAGDIDIDGDMLSPFQLRGSMKDRHPLTTVWRFCSRCCSGRCTPTRPRSPRITTSSRNSS